MKNIPTLFFIFLLCALNSLAQTAASTPTPIVSELSKLQTDYDPESGVSPLTLLTAPKDGVTYYETKAELTRRYQKLKRKIPQLSDEEIYIGMSRMLAVLNQGHRQIYNITSNRFLPIQLYVFPEGIHIINAADEYKNLIGSRVISFGDMPAEEAEENLLKR